MDIYRQPDGSFMIDYHDDVLKALHGGISKAVRKACFDVQAEAMSNLYQGHGQDTGFLKSSIYTVTHNSSTYGQGIQGEGPLLPEIDKPENDTTAFVAVGAAYGAYVEYGTSKMAAIPYFHPAFDKVEPIFKEAMAKLQGLVVAHLGGANVDVEMSGE